MRNVLITGSSHGIGAAAAIAFSKIGCNVGINYNKNLEGAQKTAEEYLSIMKNTVKHAALRGYDID